MSEEKKDYLKESLLEATEKARWREQLTKDTIHEMKTADRFVNYFNGFRPESVNSFINHYALLKVIWHEHGDNVSEYKIKKNSQWIEKAWAVLAHIQFAKMFYLEALWRANKIKLEGIEIGLDWEQWNDNIFKCPLIEPISPEEVKMYKDYIDSMEPEDEIDWFVTCGSNWWYDRNMEPDWFSKWFTYYLSKTGNADILSLSDERGIKELFYVRLHTKDEREKDPEKYKPNYPADQRPRIPYHWDRKFWEPFIKAHESKEVYDNYRVMMREKDKRDFMEFAERELPLLKEAEGYNNIPSHDDWREGIKQAGELYKRRKTVQMLDAAFNDYMHRLEHQQEMVLSKDIHVLKLFNDTYRRNRMTWIKHGRELNGEPPDLNF